MRQRGRQQENGDGKTDIEKQLGPQDDGADSGGNWTNRDPMFVVFGVIAVLCVDPLFLYLPVINENDKCVELDRRLKITAISLRSFFDVIYLANMILEFPYLRKRFPCLRKSHLNASRPTSGRTELTNQCLRYLKFVIGILAILPIPQVFFTIIYSKMKSSKFYDIRKPLNALVFLQYVPRVLPIYLSWRKLIQSSKTLARSIWIIAGLNFFVYILASHVLGAFWYFYSIDREMVCWHVACENHIGCTPSSFNCGSDGRYLGNYTFLEDACPVQTPNTTLFDFGIFLEALQSGTVSSTNIPQKIVYCFWWGLRNLSSFGQNLQTSTYIGENGFAVFISIFGLLLFLYFIGNVQTYIQMATEKATKKATEKAEMEAKKLEMEAKKLEMATEKAEMEAKKLEKISHQMKIKKTTIQLWISKHKLPDDIKKQVIACIKQRLEENKDFDTEKPIHHLSNKELLKEIKRHLCLPLLKKVQILNKKKLYLLWICESLKPIYYNEDSYIFREGEPLTAMLFITQGSVWCFKTSNGDQNGEGSVSCAQCIEKGEFYGEELLEWGFKGSPSPKLSDLPISKTVKTLTKVEAFALTANDWKMIVARYAQATSQAVSFAKDFRRRINEKINKSSPKMAEQNNASCHALSASRLAVLQD